MKYLLFTFLLVSLFAFNSCGFPEHYFTTIPECNDENLQLISESEVLKILKTTMPKDYRYKFKNFDERKEGTYMLTSFRTTKSCFDVYVLVDNWDKLAGMKRTNGYSYPKELYDLKWKIVEDAGKEVVMYIDMSTIID